MIGFDRKVELEWLDVAAARASDGADTDEIRDHLLAFLDSLAFRNEASGSARAKTARVILRIWGDMEPRTAPMRKDALKLLTTVPVNQRLAIHWALTTAAYPFFADHAAAAGRLLGLHDTVSASQILRRVSEAWGERSTVVRTSRHVMRTMVDWGVLTDSAKGVYGLAEPRRAVDGRLGELLVEAVLLANECDPMPLGRAVTHPALFPFSVCLSANDLRASARLRVFREGLDQELVAFREMPC